MRCGIDLTLLHVDWNDTCTDVKGPCAHSEARIVIRSRGHLSTTILLDTVPQDGRVSVPCPASTEL